MIQFLNVFHKKTDINLRISFETGAQGIHSLTDILTTVPRNLCRNR